jgi:hypothetical protein
MEQAWEDPIIAELQRTRDEILAEFGGDFEAYLDYLDAVEVENRKRGVRYATPTHRSEPSRSVTAPKHEPHHGDPDNGR